MAGKNYNYTGGDMTGLGGFRDDKASLWSDYAQGQANDERNALNDERMAIGRSVYDDMLGSVRKNAAYRRQRTDLAAYTLLSAFKLGTMSEDGTVPPEAYNALTNAFGYDGKTKSVQGGKVLPNGDVGFAVMETDPETGVQNVRMKKFPFQQVYGIAMENPGVFSRDELMNMRENVRERLGIPRAHLKFNSEIPEIPEDYGMAKANVQGAAPDGNAIPIKGSWLRGPRKPANISAFGANGRGGFTRYESSDATGHRLVIQDYGTRAEKPQVRWKLLSSGADGKRYENSLTGEVISVKPGQTIESAARGVTEREKIAQMSAESKRLSDEMRDERERDIADAKNEASIEEAKIRAEAARDIAKERLAADEKKAAANAKVDKTALAKLEDELRKLTENDDGSKREDMTDEEKARASEIQRKIDGMLGIRVDGSGAPVKMISRDEWNKMTVEEKAAYLGSVKRKMNNL